MSDSTLYCENAPEYNFADPSSRRDVGVKKSLLHSIFRRSSTKNEKQQATRIIRVSRADKMNRSTRALAEAPSSPSVLKRIYRCESSDSKDPSKFCC
mmetsp:Transcript_7985/g.9132  ORF Transcript_7985/g.9132 Transcript_7985/m.9132 type:complete len:97 (-) Transcript_7985:254-544(-)